MSGFALTLDFNRNTKPGGYCEFIDFDIKWTSLDGTLDEESPVWKISREFIKLCAENGMEASLGPHLESLVKNAGFANVVATRVPLPVGTWPADKRLVRDLSMADRPFGRKGQSGVQSLTLDVTSRKK
jgi:hypothetical protein